MDKPRSQIYTTYWFQKITKCLVIVTFVTKKMREGM